MPGELLSRAELESLLRAPGARPPSRAERGAEAFRWPALEAAAAPALQSPRGAELARLRALQQRFAQCLGEATAPLLGCPLRIDSKEVTATDGDALLSRGPGRACLLVLEADAECPLVVQLSHDVLGPMLDRMLGSGPDTAPLAPRPLTEIEKRLVTKIAAVISSALHAAWEMPGPCTVHRIESDPAQCHEFQTREQLLEFRFELGLGPAQGEMCLVVPMALIPQPQPAPEQATADPQVERTVPQAESQDESDTVEVVVRLKETQITAGELMRVQVGDVVSTAHPHDRPLEVHVDGQLRWQGRVGASQGRKAVRLVADPLEECGPDAAPS